MRYGPDTLRHYLRRFAERHGIDDGGEIDELCLDFEGTFDCHLQRIAQLEHQVSALGRAVEALNALHPTMEDDDR